MRASFRNRVALLLMIGLLVSSLVVGCANPQPAANDDRLAVTVSIVPQRYFVERIGGERVSVGVMVQPGNSPATYEPKPEQLVALSRSAAYFSIGVPFENAWLDRIAAANDEMRLVDTVADIERIPIAAHAHEGENEHEEKSEDDHEHEGGAPDPHVWLSPRLVAVQARAIHSALVELDPDHASAYDANLEAFLADIDALDAEIELTLADHRGRAFMVFHPSWGYFAHDYGLKQIAVEVGGQEPSAQELAHLIEEAREEGIRVILAQPEFSVEDAETIAKGIGGEVLLISPLAEDWLSNMRTVADTFADVLGE